MRRLFRGQHRPWFRRKLTRKFTLHGFRLGRQANFLLTAALGIGLALLCIFGFDRSVRPTLIAIAETKTQSAVTAIINEAVNKTIAAQSIAYDDIILLQTDLSGRITALTSHSAEMNRLRGEVLDEIIRKMDMLDIGLLGVPLGNLTGLASLSGAGPVLPVRVLSVASADAVFSNRFSAAGINQTHHQVLLDVTVELKLLISGGTIEKTVKTQVNIAETVIVGQVPDAYLQFGQTQ